MSRKIHCDCGEYLGEIRDATLKKAIVFKCDKCQQQDKIAIMFGEACASGLKNTYTLMDKIDG